MTRSCVAVLVLGTAVLFGCGRSESQRPSTASSEPPRVGLSVATLPVTSPAFASGQPIGKQYTEDGTDQSPELQWGAPPVSAKQLVLIVDDPDAPSAEPWVHWVLYQIPVSMRGLPAGVAKEERPSVLSGAVQGKNSWGTVGYRGPAPPKGAAHHYHFTLYAIDSVLTLSPGLEKAQVLGAIQGHIVGQGELVGTYQR